jgi:NAD(P)-dependent dehydrogenase (short-subunit alcohol dehydrogenase family)
VLEADGGAEETALMENFHVDLAEVVAVVTGASRGAGRAVATVLGEAGATVYVTGRSVRGLRRCGDVRRRMPNPSTTRDWRGTAARSVARHGGRACKRVSCAAERSKTSGRRDRSSCSGNPRASAGACGGLLRDERGVKRCLSSEQAGALRDVDAP